MSIEMSDVRLSPLAELDTGCELLRNAADWTTGSLLVPLSATGCGFEGESKVRWTIRRRVVPALQGVPAQSAPAPEETQLRGVLCKDLPAWRQAAADESKTSDFEELVAEAIRGPLSGKLQKMLWYESFERAVNAPTAHRGVPGLTGAGGAQVFYRHGCPGGLCDREEVPMPGGPRSPFCHLQSKDMLVH